MRSRMGGQPPLSKLWLLDPVSPYHCFNLWNTLIGIFHFQYCVVAVRLKPVVRNSQRGFFSLAAMSDSVAAENDSGTQFLILYPLLFLYFFIISLSLERSTA